MIDLRPTIIAKTDQLNSDALIAGPITIRVTDVRLCAEPDQPLAIHYDGDEGKPFKPCKSMRRLLVHIWGRDGKAFIGKSMTLYRDEKVIFGGAPVGGIRISHVTGITAPVKVMLTASKTSRKPYTVEPLIVAEQPKSNAALAEEGSLVEAARKAAECRGMDELKKHWAQLTKARQKILQPHMEKLKRIASETDARAEDDATETAPQSPPHGNNGAHSEAGSAPTLSASSIEDMEF